jgi:hypothetical protein
MFEVPLTPIILSIEPEALERCYRVADFMEQVYGDPLVEYGMLGLAHPSRPLHVVETPLLPGQSVTGSSVFQSGADVLRMRREILVLSRKRRAPLIPITFIHRHPGDCRPSSIDDEFLSTVFIDQISTAQTFRKSVEGHWNDYLCQNCVTKLPSQSRRSPQCNKSKFEVEYALCCSLIVNKEREHSLSAVAKQFCPACDASQLRFVPAKMEVRPNRPLTSRERDQLWKVLAIEIEAKVQFAS